MLKRLDRKQELASQEEKIKQQRHILEAEKKKLREDIAELDDLKSQLEQRKKDGISGASDLDMKSFKSKDLHLELSMKMSRYSKNYVQRERQRSGIPHDQQSFGPDSESRSAFNMREESKNEPKAMSEMEVYHPRKF